MMSRQKFIACFAAVLITLPVLYGLVDPSLPVWGLFCRFDRFDYALVDADGRSHRIRDYVQTRAYVTCDRRLVHSIALWLVESGHARPPLWGRLTAWDDAGRPVASEFRVALVHGTPNLISTQKTDLP
jgi:hypothetical protein